MLMIGQLLYGYCAGYFGRDSYYDKRVEALGVDWVVVRYVMGGYNENKVDFASIDPAILEKFTDKAYSYDEYVRGEGVAQKG